MELDIDGRIVDVQICGRQWEQLTEEEQEQLRDVIRSSMRRVEAQAAEDRAAAKRRRAARLDKAS